MFLHAQTYMNGFCCSFFMGLKCAHRILFHFSSPPLICQRRITQANNCSNCSLIVSFMYSDLSFSSSMVSDMGVPSWTLADTRTGVKFHHSPEGEDTLSDQSCRLWSYKLKFYLVSKSLHIVEVLNLSWFQSFILVSILPLLFTSEQLKIQKNK